MSTTRPTSEQVRFRSSKTGEHILDTYLEDAERGDRTLPDLMSDLFDASGVFVSDVEFRVTAQSLLQYRIGAGDWLTTSSFFKPRGSHLTATAYAYLDMVDYAGSLYVANLAHTSNTASPSSNFTKIMDGALFAGYVSDAQTAQAAAEAARDQSRAYSGAIPYTFSTLTVDADPSNGIVRFNNASPASVTQIYIDNNEQSGASVTTWVDSFDDSTNSTHKGTLTIRQGATSKFAIFQVTGSIVDGSGYRKITVIHLGSSGTFDDASTVGVAFSRTGNDATATAGLGDVNGPATHPNNYVPLWSGTNSKVLAAGRAIGAASSTDLIDRSAGDTRYQPLTTKLTNFSALTGASNKLPYFSGTDTLALADLTSFARTILDDADAAAARTTLGLSNVDNTSDVNKPVSTAQAAADTALATRASALEAGLETPYQPTISAGVLTIDLSLAKSDVKVALTANISSIVYSNAPTSGTLKSWTLRFTADGTLRTIVWPSSVKHNGGTDPTLVGTAGKTVTFVQFTDDGGAKIHTFKSGETG